MVVFRTVIAAIADAVALLAASVARCSMLDSIACWPSEYLYPITKPAIILDSIRDRVRDGMLGIMLASQTYHYLPSRSLRSAAYLDNAIYEPASICDQRH